MDFGYSNQVTPQNTLLYILVINDWMEMPGCVWNSDFLSWEWKNCLVDGARQLKSNERNPRIFLKNVFMHDYGS